MRTDSLVRTVCSATCEKIRDLLPSCTVFSEDFDLYDVKGTLKKIDLFIEEQSIDMVIGLGLGAFYALARTAEPLRLAINPCMRPSLELPQVYPDIQQKESVLADFSEQEVMMYTLALLGPAS